MSGIILSTEIQSLDRDIEAILMECIKDKANADRYMTLLTRLTAEHEKARMELNSLETQDANLQRKLKELAKQVSSLDEVLKNTPIAEPDLHSLPDYIEVKQNGKS